MGGHDGEIVAYDFDRTAGNRGPEGRGFVYRAVDRTLESGVKSGPAFEQVFEEARERLDPEDYEHHEVVARIWVEDARTVDRVDWTDD